MGGGVVGGPARLELRQRVDATSMFTLFAVLLICIPSILVFAPLGAAGTPAQLVGMLMLLWWAADWLARTQTDDFVQTPQPIVRALLVFAGAVVASYVAAAIRPIDAIELSSADRGLLSLCAWTGTVVVAAQRIPSRDRLDTLLRRIVMLGGALAGLGLVQFFTGMELTNYITVPGLSLNADLDSVISRQGFSRPAGTAIHPIEFGVVITMILPLALHYAFRDGPTKGMRVWLPPSAIAFAVLLSISRSAVLGCLVVMLFLLGAFRDLFLGIQEDDSALSRTGSYGLAWDFITRSPLIGRGYGTFLPEYRILDNEYLGMVIETGIVGLLSLLALFGTGIATGMRMRRRCADPVTGDLAQSLAAAVAAGAVCFAIFDALEFPMTAGLMFLLLGCIAALRRLTPSVDAGQTTAMASTDR